jgi:hypothetical protein
MTFSTSTLLVGFVLMLVQFLAALPWLSLAFVSSADWQALRRKPFSSWLLQRLAIGLVVCAAVPFLVLLLVQNRDSLEITGRLYAAVLQLQITVDLFILLFALVLWLWPKGGAVALAAFREGIRQGLFWLLTGMAASLMFASVFVPYFTFGEDYLMVKQLGYDTIMLAAILFGALTASLSISDEIEGRTAITVMSKPVSRRQFMLGKYGGILLAALFMFGLLGVYFEGILLVKHWWEKLEPLTRSAQEQKLTAETWIGVVPTPAWVIETLDKWALPSQVTDVLRGIGQWLAHSADTIPGLILCFSQVMVLVALAVALATRVPLVVNLVSVLTVYFLAHLTPVLLAITDKAEQNQGGSLPVQMRLVRFVAQAFDYVLPDLGSFRMDPALLSDVPPPPLAFMRYVGSVTMYGVMYTAMVLLLGLILFEDRDLA